MRVRARLTRLAERMAPPPIAVLEALFGALDHRVLVELCRVGVPDRLTRRTTVGRLARELDVDAVRLERMMRFAAARGWVRIDRRGRVRPTRVTAFLRREHPGGWRAWVDFAGGDEVTAAIGALSVRADDVDTFASVNGAGFFDFVVQHPERGVVFDRAMAAGGRMHGLALAAAVDWSTTRTICDVGGGTGDLLASLLDVVPQATGVVVDLEPVVARAVRHVRMTAQPGDAFTAVPPEFDTYLLVNVLHDWSDDDAVRILRTIAAAVGPGGRVLVVEGDRPAVPHDRVATGVDVLMAALTDGGRERGPDEYGRLAERAGLRRVRSHRLASADWAHELRPLSWWR